MKNALITGITGQDGSYLAELLLNQGYKVYGLTSRRSTINTQNLTDILDDLELIKGDMTDTISLKKAVEISQPDEVYNLAAMSFVKDSWDLPEYTFDVNATGTQRLLDAVYSQNKKARFYQAGSSEQFGLVQEVPQNEKTPFYPRSPYGISKVAAYWIAKNFRESYGYHISSAILFNHESNRRGQEFVTQKIATAAAKIKLGLQSELRLGNLEAKRDIGHSKDYVRGMWSMLQQDEPDDYVLATGETYSIRQMLEIIFSFLNLRWEEYVVQDEKFMRPAEVDLLIGDSSKAREKLGWKPKYNAQMLLEEMTIAQMTNIKKGKV